MKVVFLSTIKVLPSPSSSRVEMTNAQTRPISELSPQNLADRLRDYQSSAEGNRFPELVQRANQLEVVLRGRLEILAQPAPQVAFVAHKGVGKSTLINGLSGLWLDGEPPSADASSVQLNKHAVLPLGNGGTTPCEIVLRPGNWEIQVEPEKDEDAARLVQQFAEWAWHKAHDPSSAASGDDETEEPSIELLVTARPPRLQPDLERVLWGLTGLKREKISTGAGKVPGSRSGKSATVHHAVEAARSFERKEDFVDHVLQLARLSERRRIQWLPDGEPRTWLRHMLLSLFKGELADQPFPRRVVVQGPFDSLQWNGRAVPLVDTLGLPAVTTDRDVAPGTRRAYPLADRADLRVLLKQPWTLIVLASSFNEPPAPAVELLTQMVEERGYFGETLAERTVVAIVDAGRAGSGHFEDKETERETKEDRCAENLVQLGCPGWPSPDVRWSVDDARQRVRCVNVLDGGTPELYVFLEESLSRLAGGHARLLEEAAAQAREFFHTLADAKRRTLYNQVVKELSASVQAAIAVSRGKLHALGMNFLRPFSSECQRLHPSSLRSLVQWKGDGTQNAWALLEFSASRALEHCMLPLFSSMHVRAEELRKRDVFEEEDNARLIDAELEQQRRQFDVFVQVFTSIAVQVLKEQMLNDDLLWARSHQEWGTGMKQPSYRERVAAHFEQWGEYHAPVVSAAISQRLPARIEKITDAVQQLISVLLG
ncbi:hypothetical protein [Corallococcus exercitus]|uniref:hypothetical protein n=1 Tax=Corallococcus exercitus TaxID=2316736 RepID=UPI0011C4ABD9|nr:hypothetical protein [Corallococcus exercitus]